MTSALSLIRLAARTIPVIPFEGGGIILSKAYWLKIRKIKDPTINREIDSR